VVCTLLEKIELLHAVGTQISPPHAGEIVKSLYDILNVLDEKGLALLAFDGIVVAAPPLPQKGRRFSPARIGPMAGDFNYRLIARRGCTVSRGFGNFLPIFSIC
jgi:hypothetical protein